MSQNTDNEPVEYPIDGTLDLHLFAPKDTHDIVLEYITACLEAGVFSLRIVHGKGIGVKRRIVQKLLDNHANVISYKHESGSGGGWGATVVDLREEQL